MHVWCTFMCLTCVRVQEAILIPYLARRGRPQWTLRPRIAVSLRQLLFPARPRHTCQDCEEGEASLKQDGFTHLHAPDPRWEAQGTQTCALGPSGLLQALHLLADTHSSAHSSVEESGLDLSPTCPCIQAPLCSAQLARPHTVASMALTC